MKEYVDIINIVLPLFYLITFGVYTYDFIAEKSRLSHVKRVFLFINLLLHIKFIVIRSLYVEHFPITNVFEIFSVLACACIFSYFVLELLTDVRGTGPFIIIISFLFQAVSSIFIKDEMGVRDILKSNLLGTHVITALLGYSAITISAVYGFLYLMLYKEIKQNKFGIIFNKLPNLEILEKLSYYSAFIGFVFLSLAIFIGIIWLPRAFPTFSYADPKLIGTGIVWLLYGAGILSKILGRWKGKKIIILSIIAFITAILSTLLTNFIAKSFHSFY